MAKKSYNVQSCGQFYVKGVSHYGPVNNILLEDQEVEVLKACGIAVVSTVKAGVVVAATEVKTEDKKDETTENKTDTTTDENTENKTDEVKTGKKKNNK